MTNAQSKATAVLCTCKEFQHPWTDKCVNATAGLLLSAIPYCLRVYAIVYVLSMLMRHRMPTVQDIKRTLLGIIQSTAFLVTNGWTFIFYNCLMRHVMGRYHVSTVAFWPSFLASLTAIAVERPARVPLLTLYVANVATETLWHMAEERGYVRALPQGQTLIFGLSISILLYLYRLGLHKTKCKDSMFNVLRIFVGKLEEGPLQQQHRAQSAAADESARRPIDFGSIRAFLQIYERCLHALKQKHASCAHLEPCTSYVLLGGIRTFAIGLSLQVSLKTFMNLRRILQMRMQWQKQIFNAKTLKLGVFLGGFSFLYRSISCTLRHSFGYDDARFALPAGFIASMAFTQYPDVTVALYVMWKMLQILYKYGILQGKLPRIPGFIYLLYATCTATLFHAGILEPATLRSSYFKFLEDMSGGRLSRFNLLPFDVYGYKSSANAREVLKRLNLRSNKELPKFAMSF